MRRKRYKRWESRKTYRRLCRLRRREAQGRLKDPEWWAMVDWIREELRKEFIKELNRTVLYGEGVKQ